MHAVERSMRRFLVTLLVLGAGFVCLGEAWANSEIFPAMPAAQAAVGWKDGYFLVNGQPTFITAGELHYARIPRKLWRDRLWRVKQMGFNCIQMYVFWNAHEPKEGQWDFSDNLDLDAWLSLIQEMGLYAIVRVGPYSCAEWEHGGFPAWLTIKPGMVLRDMDEQYNRYADEHLAKIYDIVGKHQIHKGGNVLMVQLENEHAKGWGTDKYPYLMHLYEKARAAGLEIPLFFSGLHHGGDPSGESPYKKGDSPWYSTEFWTGWIGRYGDMPESMLNEKIRGTWKIISFGGAGYDYYVVHGGTNFGYSGDSMEATYDYSSPIGEAGQFHNLYAPARRAALFAQSFSRLLTASDNDSGFARPTTAGVRVTTRKSPYGTIVFADNFVRPADKNKAARQIAPTAGAYQAEAAKPGKGDVKTKLALAGAGDFPKGGDLILHPNDLRTAIFGLPWTAGCAFESISTNVLLRQEIGGLDTWVCYGQPGEYGEVTLKRTAAGLPASYSFTYPAQGEVKEILMDSGDGKKARFLVMNTALADRTWLANTKLVIGAAFIREDGTAELPPEGGKLIVYQASGRSEETRGKAEVPGLPELTGWEWRDAARERLPNYDDAKWLTSQKLQAMEAHDSFQNRYGWYRTTLKGNGTAAPLNLRFTGSHNRELLVFLNGQPADLQALSLKPGENSLAIFAKIGPRPKLYSFLGAIGLNAARGIWGPAISTDKPLVAGTAWKLLKTSGKDAGKMEYAKPEFDDHGWETVAADATKKGINIEGGCWLRASFEIPAQIKCIIAYLPESSRATRNIFVNGQALPPGMEKSNPADFTPYLKPGKNSLAIQLKHAGKGDEKFSVKTKLEFWQADEEQAWKFRGGLEGLEETAIIGRVLNWPEFIGKPWSKTAAPADAMPRFWKSTFVYHPQARETVGLLTTGLKSGHAWLNGHNLGECPQKVPLYMPECWLRDGPNELVVFDTQGTMPDQVKLQRYEARQVVPLK